VDSRLESPESARLFQGGKVLVFAAGVHAGPAQRLAARGAEVVVLPDAHGKVDLAAMLSELARRGTNELHVEAGFRLNGSLLREDCEDELLVYLAPSLIGNGGRGMFDLPQIEELERQRRLTIGAVDRIGEDVRLLARVAR
jgi:diaminohydroxyphosphoribosylaminopyrimidine deaminase/5-amino-6-(5-phosphoribosylamino)uracil reductase